MHTVMLGRMLWSSRACAMCAQVPKHGRLYAVAAPTRRAPRRTLDICQACRDTRYIAPEPTTK